jgi:hypothetical protein
MEIILLCILLIPVLFLTCGIAFIVLREVIEEFRKSKTNK